MTESDSTKDTLKKIAIFNGGKGRQGKTPLGVELALRLGFGFATNEERDRADVRALFSKEYFKQIEPDGLFPRISEKFKVLFDLAGSIRGFENSILSALAQSQIVVIPVVNESDSISGTAQSIVELRAANINVPIVVIANMLCSHHNGDYRLGKDFRKIKRGLTKKVGEDLIILPLKYSKGFEHLFKQKKSIETLVQEGGLNRHHYRLLSKQIDDIIDFLFQIEP